MVQMAEDEEENAQHGNVKQAQGRATAGRGSKLKCLQEPSKQCEQSSKLYKKNNRVRGGVGVIRGSYFQGQCVFYPIQEIAAMQEYRTCVATFSDCSEGTRIPDFYIKSPQYGKLFNLEKQSNQKTLFQSSTA